MFYRFTITIVLCLYILSAFSQGQVGEGYIYSNNFLFCPVKNIDSLLYVAVIQLQKAEKKKDEPARAKAFADIAFVHIYKGQPDSAIFFYKKAKNIFLAEKNYESAGYIDIALAKIYIGQYKIDTALSYLILADSLSRVLDNPSMQADVQWEMGLVYKNKKEYANAAKHFKTAQNTFFIQKNFSKYILAGCHLSMAYRLMNQNDSSLQALAQCISVFNNQPQSDSLLYTRIDEEYGDTYLEMGRYQKALTHFKAALTQFIKYSSTADIAYQKYSIGRTLTKMSRFKDAEAYLLQSYRISDSLKNYKYLVWISNALNQMYVKLEDWHNAYAYLQKKAAWSDTIGIYSRIEKTNALNKKFESEEKEKEIVLLKSRNQIIVWAFISGILGLFISGLLIWLYRTRKKIKEERILNYFATSLYNQNTVDDVFWDIAKNCVSKLRLEDCVLYGYDEPRNILVQKAAYGPKNPNEYQITNYLEIPVGQGIVGSVAQSLVPEIVNDVSRDARYITDDKARSSEITVPIVVEGKLIGIIDSEHSKKGFYSKRHLRIFQKIADICSKKITRHLVEEGLRKKIARDLHDDIGSALTSINVASKIALQKEERGTNVAAYLEKINMQSGSMMDSMSDIIWAIKPDNNNFENTFSHIKEFASELCEPIGIDLEFDLPESLNPVIITSDIRKNIFLIFKESINNAVKYSGCTMITTRFLLNGKRQVSMKITDNGCGFDEAAIKPGNGLMNMRERARQINGTLHISKASPGTVVQLLFTI